MLRIDIYTIYIKRRRKNIDFNKALIHLAYYKVQLAEKVKRSVKVL